MTDPGSTPPDRDPSLGPLVQGTRLHAPRPRIDAIRRPRLTDILVDARSQLVEIVAPPGFGKTSLLADWAERDDRRFAWLSLDRSDNDRAVLWTYLAAALAGERGLSIDILGGMARDPDPALAVLNELSPATDTVLVLDDYHVIQNEDCHASIARLVELRPENLQLVIASRTNPPLPVARLRAGGQLIELGATDLAFTVEECEALLNGRLGLGLDPAAIALLHDRTEGWPAGLYLAYLSLRRARDREAFIATFDATNRHVGDYLTEQVLSALEPEELEFMLATSIVDAVCGPLADALTEGHDSATRLDELARANVFFSPVDERREWFRYHHLLAEHLRNELHGRAPDTERLLHLRASAWFESVGDAEGAIHHAIAGADVDRASRLIGGAYLKALELGRLTTIAAWLAELGDEGVASDPRLSVVKAWVMHFTGFHDEGEAAISAALSSSFDGMLPDGASSMEASAALMRAAFPGGDVGAMLTNARRAFELESHPRSPWRITVHVLLGFALVRSGRFAEADPYLKTGARLAIAKGMWMDAVGAQTLRGKIQIETGDPELAQRYAREAVTMADDQGLLLTPTGAFAMAILGAILVRRGDASGEVLLDDAIPSLRTFGEPLPLADALLATAQARLAADDRRSALVAYTEAANLLEGMVDPGYLTAARKAVARALGPVRQAGVPLSARERDVLLLLGRGLSKRDIAGQLFVSYNTVHSHTRSIYRKLGVTSREDAVRRAAEDGVIEAGVKVGRHPSATESPG